MFFKNYLILDDVLEQVGNCKAFQALATGASSHLNMTIMFCTQILHGGGDVLRSFIRNSDFLFLFNSVKLRHSYQRIAIDMGYKGWLIPEIMKKIQSIPYSYLIVDQRNGIDEVIRFRLGSISDLSNLENVYIFLPT